MSTFLVALINCCLSALGRRGAQGNCRAVPAEISTVLQPRGLRTRAFAKFCQKSIGIWKKRFLDARGGILSLS